MTNLRSIAFLLVISVGAVAHATVRHVPIKSGVVLKPGEPTLPGLNRPNRSNLAGRQSELVIFDRTVHTLGGN